jgi:guanylate kinase
VAGEVDVYSDGKDYAFVIPAEFESLHAQPQEG